MTTLLFLSKFRFTRFSAEFSCCLPLLPNGRVGAAAVFLERGSADANASETASGVNTCASAFNGPGAALDAAGRDANDDDDAAENALDAAGRDADDDNNDAENDDVDATEAKEEDFSAGMDGVVPTIGVVDGVVERHFFSRHDN